jgi:hypothetical protein
MGIPYLPRGSGELIDRDDFPGNIKVELGVLAAGLDQSAGRIAVKSFSDEARGLFVAGVIGGLMVSFRFISLPILVAALILSRRTGATPQRRLSAIIVWGALFVSLLSPVDVALFGWPMHHGERQPGLRLVPLVFGLPAHHSLREKYGEYYTGGCCPNISEPRWVLTWD